MSRSLRHRLVLSLCGSLVSAWIVTAFFTYFDTRGLIEEVTDAHIKHSAEMILGLADHVPEGASDGLLMEGNGGQPLTYRILTTGPQTEAVTAAKTGLAAADGRVGYSDVVDHGVQWRVYGARDDKGTHVSVAVRQQVRESFASRVAAHIIHPVWIAVPVLAALIWGLVRWGLAPLEHLTSAVGRRSPNDLSSLNPEAAPTEVMPLVDALNALFGRIAAARERDRRFAADAAHELRTPLAAIRAHAQVAIRAEDLAGCREALADVLVGVDRGTRIVEQLLALARVEHDAAGATPQPIDMLELARDTIAPMAPQAAARDIDLGLEADPDLEATVRGNADLLSAMLRNVVDNAIRYGQEGTQVTVRLTRQGDSLILRVEDTGPGIPPELRARVLDRFFRAAGGATQGSGLGLPIAAAIAESHGGSLTLGGRAGGPGLVVTISLPLVAAAKDDGP